MSPDVLEFHRRTNHTYASVRRRSRGLDWSNRPDPFKEYPDLPLVDLPAPRQARPRLEPGRLTRESLAHILYYSAGITRIREFDGEGFDFRAYASAGALYPIEMYAITGDLEDLKAGVYHYHPKHHALRALRDGDQRGFLNAATANDPAIATAPLTLVLTGIPWRTMWKYEARGYRHLYWDGGMVLANLFAVCEPMGVAAKLLLGFVDDAVDRLLGVDGRHELSLALVALGRGPAIAAAPEDLPTIEPRVEPLSRQEIEYPDALAAHDASRLRSVTEVERWKGNR
jgi:SagB-type dehydrogenase family enzyme